jgi:small multidrug resistance pump
VVVAGYAVSFFMLSKALRVIPVGIAYAIWSGVGTVAVTAISWWVFKQKLDWVTLSGMACIVVGVIVINLAHGHG